MRGPLVGVVLVALLVGAVGGAFPATVDPMGAAPVARAGLASGLSPESVPATWRAELKPNPDAGAHALAAPVPPALPRLTATPDTPSEAEAAVLWLPESSHALRGPPALPA